jgi:glutathione S-transferase
MSLTFHFHPLSSFCHKALIGLYELDVPFNKHIVDFSDPAARAAFLRLWPVGKFPLLEDDSRGLLLPESTIILEYLDAWRASDRRLIPRDTDAARDCRLRDRFFDLYIHHPMQKIVGDRLRLGEKRDPYGVAEAKSQIETSYAIVDDWLCDGPWVLGDVFTMADCAAAPALYYANKVVPFAADRRNLAAYFARLEARPSYARVLEEAKPYLSLFPG